MEKNMYEKMVKNTREKVEVHELINFEESSEKPKVSIVVPVCNVEIYLEECLQSLMNQSLQEIEIICVNDGSTDNSLEILKKFAKQDKRFKIIDKDNAGYGHTMNIGMDMSKGKYIGIVESDDFVDENMYRDLYELAEKEHLDLIKADFNRFVKEDGELKCNYIDVAARAKDCYNKVIDPSEDKRVFNLVMQTWSGIYNREFLIKNGIRHHESPGASYQDNGFWFQTFIFAKRVYFYNKPYNFNIRDNPNSSVNSKEKVYCMNVEYDFVRDIFMQKGNEELWERFKAYYNYKRYFSYTFTIGRISDEFKREYVDRISREFKRAQELEELDMSVFTPRTRERLSLLIKDPDGYYQKYALFEGSSTADQIRKLERELNDVRRSTTFKIGKAMMFLPRSIKKKVVRRK